MSDERPIIFDEALAQRYDSYNASLQPINLNLHFLMRLILADLPANAEILCVGVGTGSDILALADAFPGWRFTGVDPSQPMLNICRHKLAERGLADRCQLQLGEIDVVASHRRFDAVICLLVAHFIRPPVARQALFDHMAMHTRPGGRLIHAEISADLDAADFDNRLTDWMAMHQLASGQPGDRAAFNVQFRETLAIQAPAATAQMISAAGFQPPIAFFQALMIHGWHARRPA